jgi:hypothetical protein
MTSGYVLGRQVEWAVIHDLQDNGYGCTRAASSKGICDVMAIKPGQILLINVKRTTPPGPAERAELWRRACQLNTPEYRIAWPLVALGPATNVTYRELTGTGPSDWVAWTPDEVGAA